MKRPVKPPFESGGVIRVPAATLRALGRLAKPSETPADVIARLIAERQPD